MKFKQTNKTFTRRYTLYGILFGLCFPVLSTISEIKQITFENIIIVQTTTPLLWVIDSAPFWLGLFAYMIGIKQDKLNEQIIALQIISIKRNMEIKKREKIEKNLREKSRFNEEDMEAARVVQESFLPEIPVNDLINISYYYTPMRAIGGDFISLVKLKEGGISVLIGDVIGHGVSAALITTLVIAMANKACKKFGTSPFNYLKYLNNSLIDNLPENNYITALYALFRRNNNGITLTLSRAAHPYPVVWKKKDSSVKLLKPKGMPLGYMFDLSFNEKSYNLNSGDRIFLFTDGITEASNKHNDYIGFDGISRIIKSANCRKCTIQDTISIITNEITIFTQGNEIKDDQILIGIEVK